MMTVTQYEKEINVIDMERGASCDSSGTMCIVTPSG